MVNRTNITAISNEPWKWTGKEAVDFEYSGVSEYAFKLFERESKGKGGNKVEG